MNKDSKLACALGDVDELNSVIGVALANLTDEHVSRGLKVIQDKLFKIGAELSSSVEGGIKPEFSLSKEDIRELESSIDSISAKLPPLKKFVLPGGTAGASNLHLARSVARRAERSVIAFSSEAKISESMKAYLNRLSSYFFVAALYVNKEQGVEEDNPTYG